MANRKLRKPTKGITAGEESGQPLINFGFLFRRSQCQLLTSANPEGAKQSSSASNLTPNDPVDSQMLDAISSAEHANCAKCMESGSDSCSARPPIRYTALLSCAELIHASLRDKHMIQSIFPYYDLLKAYKTGRSSSLSSIGMDDGSGKENGHPEPNSKLANHPYGRWNQGPTKSRRSSSIVSITHAGQGRRTSDSYRSSSQGSSSHDSESSSSPNPANASGTNFEMLENNSASELEESMIASQTELSNSKVPGRSHVQKKKRCASCTASKTPYWREGWEKSILLCNACGIRYQKYKKYCLKCLSIARKDDKGRLHCPDCNDKL